jgi:hypothetical protein
MITAALVNPLVTYFMFFGLTLPGIAVGPEGIWNIIEQGFSVVQAAAWALAIVGKIDDRLCQPTPGFRHLRL